MLSTARSWPSTRTHTSVETDFRHGFGEILTAEAANLPEGLGNQGYAADDLRAHPGAPLRLRRGHPDRWSRPTPRFNTGSMRNIYSPDVRAASELVVDQIAAKLKKDPYEFRREYLRNDRVARRPRQGRAGRRVGQVDAGRHRPGHRDPQGVQGRQRLPRRDRLPPATTGRDIRDGVGGPRVTRVTFAIDVGLVINPRGLEAQMQGGINDGIALALTSSLHLRDGHFLEASWDNYFYTRQWNTPPDVEVS